MLKEGESPRTAAISSIAPSIVIALNPSIIFFIMMVGWLDTLNNLEVPRWLQKAEILEAFLSSNKIVIDLIHPRIKNTFLTECNF